MNARVCHRVQLCPETKMPSMRGDLRDQRFTRLAPEDGERRTQPRCPTSQTCSRVSLQTHRCGCCCCCCWGCCVCEVEDDVQCVAIFSPRRSLLPCLSSPCLTLCLFGKALGLSDPGIVSSLFGCSSGCSPDSSTASRRPHVWSAVHTDPPRVFPPCHVSIRHIIFFMR